METLVRLSDWVLGIDIVVLAVIAAILIVRGGLNLLGRRDLVEVTARPWMSFMVAPAVIAGVKIVAIPTLVTLPVAIVTDLVVATKYDELSSRNKAEVAARAEAEAERKSAEEARAPPVRHEVFRGPIWNMWAESALPSRAGAAFEPASLEPDQEYVLIVNLAGLKFSHERLRAVFSNEAGSDFSRWLDRNKNANVSDLTVVALVDSAYFEIKDAYVKKLRVDLGKIRKAERDGFLVSGSPFQHLRMHHGETAYSFGIQTFRIKTSARTGKGSIAISIWWDGKPIDELTLTLCVAATASSPPGCDGKLAASNPRIGLDLTMKGIYPDLALHLVDQDESGIGGVLRCNSCGWPDDDYRKWEVSETADWIADRLNEITTTVGGLKESLTPEAARQEMAKAGQDIYNVVFHAREQDNDATRAFAEFMTNAQAMKKAGKPPPSLFVRITEKKPNLMLAPIGFMYAGTPDPDFVGLVANVQTPLERQEYSSSPDCLSKWVLFVPPEVQRRTALEAVLAARQPFKDWIATFKKSCDSCVIESENDFQNWLNRREDAESFAVVILSHHSANALFFDESPGSVRVLASAVNRRFATPSLVILGACGTSEPGSSEFIRQFNFRGVTSAIATSTKVEPVLAGKFLATLMNLLHQHANDSSYTVSQARFDAVRALVQEPDIGPKALAFVLAGNGALRLCVPGQKQ